MAGKNVGGVEYPLVMLVDTGGNPVNPGGGGGGGVDRELVVTTYVAVNAFAGASVGDTITMTQVLDLSGAPTTVATIWRNQTTALDLAGAPLAANIDLVGGDALTDAQLRASPVPVAQSGAVNIGTISGAVSLPTGASTSALQTTGNASLTSIDGKLSSLGQKTMAASAPVVIASDQTSIPAAQSGTWNITNISGTVSLPSGASTAALQTAGNASLVSIVTAQADGTQKSICRGGNKGATSAADVTSTPIDANTQALDVSLKSTSTSTVTATLTVETGAFTIAAGARGYSVVNRGAANGTFNGVTFEPGDGDSESPVQGFVYGAMSGNATGTSFLVKRIA